jgi:hypothetical protein
MRASLSRVVTSNISNCLPKCARPRPTDARRCQMTKFEPCAKGGDRRGVERGDDVLLDDAYDIPAEGIVVDGFTGAFELDGSGEARDDADRVRRALSKAATSNVTSHRAFIDIVHSEQSSSPPVMCSIVLEFALHEADSKTNAARALDWFEVACEATRHGSSYAGSAVKVEANGKILKISSPIAFLEESSKPKRQTLIGEARSRDAWLESGSVFVFLGQTTKTSTLSQKVVTIPENATFLGVVSERSFLSLISTIGASMDVFTADSNGARVGACGALVDSSGGASENALLDINRLRVTEARKTRIEKDEKEDVTRKRLAEQSRNTSDAVKESVRYAAGSSSKKQKRKRGASFFLGSKYSSLLQDTSSSSSSSSSE